MSAQKPWTWGRPVDDDGTPLRGETAVAYVTTCVRAGGDRDFYAVLTIAEDGKPADVCHTGNGPNSQRNAQRIAALPLLEAAIRGLLASPYGCSLCDSGVPRNPAKGHQPDCPYEAARALVTHASPDVEVGSLSEHAATPGPWRVIEDSEDGRLFVAGPDAIGVAMLPPGVHRGHPEHSFLADARLISAAPDLLRACKMVAEMAVAWQPLTSGDIEEVRGAIAKATGDGLEQSR